VLAKSALAEAAPAAAEVAAMQAGSHPILTPAREAVEQRALALLGQLREAGEGAAVKEEEAAAAEAGA